MQKQQFQDMESVRPRFQGKTAIVLGGTSGIGFATCRMLVNEGAHVVACSRSLERCQQAQESMSSGPGMFTSVPVDVLDREGLKALFDAHSGFDYLVATATGGNRAIGSFLDMDMDGFQASFAKLWGYANAVRFGVPHLRSYAANSTQRAGSGSAVVLVSGSPARKCRPGSVALSCVGGAVENLVRALATELSTKNIRVNGVSPGLIDTPMFDSKGSEKAEFLIKSTAGNPIPRAGTPEEVAAAILFVLENEFVTGTIIDVDGGASVP